MIYPEDSTDSGLPKYADRGLWGPDHPHTSNLWENANWQNPVDVMFFEMDLGHGYKVQCGIQGDVVRIDTRSTSRSWRA